jgi:glucose-specific phosphotransferase system IIA component
MKRIPIYSPLTGKVVPIEEVPDPVFSAKMLGEGLAVLPQTGVAVAPIWGTLVVLHSAGHAFAVQAENDPVAVLVHIGLDTVKMKGQGFNRLASPDDEVVVGQPVVQFESDAIIRAGYSTLSPVILPDLPDGIQVEKCTFSQVVGGEDILLYVLLP